MFYHYLLSMPPGSLSPLRELGSECFMVSSVVQRSHCCVLFLLDADKKDAK